MLKQWYNPEILELGVENTEHGGTTTNNIDGIYTDPNHPNDYFAYTFS